MVTITDIAERAGVAKSTVSNVLTGKKYVSEELKKKILDICDEMHYYPNFYASRLSSKKSSIIALFVEPNNQIDRYPFYGELIVSCVSAASRRDYSLLICYEKDTESMLANLRQGRAPIDGAIIMAPCVDDSRFIELENDRIKCVSIGRPTAEHAISYVDVDNTELVYSVVNSLRKTYKGDFYLLNSAQGMTISSDRDEGFVTACRDLSIDFSDKIIHINSNIGEKEGYEFAKAHMKRDNVFLTHNEMVAKGVYKAIEASGLEVGRDVGVFALGRSIESGQFVPKLSYCKQNYKQIGELAINILIDEIERDLDKQVMIAENKLVFRDSTKK